MKPVKCEWRGEAGQALVETAIAIPLLFALLLGAAEFARFAYAAIEVSNAANAAVDYGASSHTAATDSVGIANAATTDAANLPSLSVPSITTSCTCVDTTYTPSSCSDNTTCSKNGTAMIETVTVKTQTTYDPLIYVPGGPRTITLNGQASRTVSNQ